MDAATLIERIDRELQEQDPIFAALQEALSGCAADVTFAVPRSVLENLEPACRTSAAVALTAHELALYGAI